MRPNAHEWFVLSYAAGWLAFFVVGRSNAGVADALNVLYFGIGFATVWALFRAASHPAIARESARAWRLLGVAAVATLVSGIVWTVHLASHPGTELPPWVAWATCVNYPISVVAFLAFPRDARITLRDRRVALDSSLLAIGGLALTWYFMLRPALTGAFGASTAVEYFAAAAAWFVVLAACVAYVRTSNPVTRFAIGLSLTAQVLGVVSDYFWGVSAPTYRMGDAVDAFYFIAWLFSWAAARWAWHGAAEEPPAVEPEASPYHSGIAPAAFVSGAFAVLLFGVLADRSGALGAKTGIAMFATVMTWLLVARQGVELAATRRQLEAIETQKRRFGSVLDNATDYIFVLDGLGRVSWASPSVRHAFEIESSPLLFDLVHPGDATGLAAWLPTSQRALAAHPVRTRMRRSDGVWEHVELRGRDLRGDANIAGIVVNGRSRTAEIELEGRVRHAEKLATLHEMAGRIAHAFNNMLTVVQGHAELLAADPALDAKWNGDVIDMRSAASRGAAIARQLLGFSGRQAIQPEALDVAGTVDDILPTWRRLLPPGTTVRRLGDVGTLRALVDRAQFEQVMFNLVINARDSMAGGGEIVVGIGRGEAADRARRLVVSVRDSGTGMDADKQARIFEPFFTTKAPGVGTGLGLAMVDTIVRRAGGEITVVSAVGAGSTFAIALPATDASRQPAPGAVAGDAASVPLYTPGATVLLVDDEDAVRNVCQRLLSRAGFDVRACSGGAEALALAAAPGVSIDVVVTDMMMPGMSGTELIGHLVAAYPRLPIICITGFTAAGDADSAFPSQVQRVIEKPFDAADLIGAVRRAAAAGPGQGGSRG